MIPESLALLGGFLIGFGCWRLYEWWQAWRLRRQVLRELAARERQPVFRVRGGEFRGVPDTMPALRLASYD